MIRINLLASQDDRIAHRNSGWPAGSAVVGGTAAMAAVLVLTVWWIWALEAERAEVATAMAGAGATLRSLAPAVDQVRAAEALQADLQGLVDLIEDLHARRKTAARMLDHLSGVLPDDLWFSEVREDDAGVLVLGHAATLEGVSGYVTALEAADALDLLVELVDSQRGEWFDGRDIVSFEMRVSLPAPGARP